jgi:hypothetical protein
MKQVADNPEAGSAVATIMDEVPPANGDHRTEQLLEAIIACRDGNFSQRLPTGWTGVHGKMADALNDILVMSERRATEVTRISRWWGSRAT